MARHAVGLVGIGLLGTALAERFLQAGFPVIGFDVAAERCDVLARKGGRPAPSARAAATASDRLVLSLPTTPIVESVLEEIGLDLLAGKLVVDTTTGDPERTSELGNQLLASGISYLDATISGSSEQVRAGEAIVMVGGERQAFDACADLLRCFSREQFHVGSWGAGSRMKLVTNLVLGLNRAVLAEGLTFARACGVDAEQALRVLQASAAYSRVMDTKGRKMLDADFTPQARLAQHLKDVHLILAQGERIQARLPLSDLHRQLLEKLVDAGHGEADNSVIIKAFE